MKDLKDLIKLIDRLSAAGPNKPFLKKLQGSGVSISDAYTLGHAAALLAVVGFLKDDNGRARKT